MKLDMFNLRTQEVKFNAFFQYLKSFAYNGIETLQKLQSDFTKEISKKQKYEETFILMKNLIKAYEMFSIEIKDSFDFVELEDFGFCVVRMFSQLMKIIKWFLKLQLKSSKKKDKTKINMHKENTQETQIKQKGSNICPMCEQILKNADSLKEGDQNAQSGQSKSYSNMLKQIKSKLQQAQQENKIQEIKQRNIYQFQQQILQRKNFILNMETSSNQNLIEQVLNQFSIKTQAMNKFISNTQASFIQATRKNYDSDYPKLELQLKTILTDQFNQAKQKLKCLVIHRIAQHQKIKRQSSITIDTQTVNIEVQHEKRSIAKIKQLNSVIQKLKNQLEAQKQLSQSLRQLMQSKSLQFQSEFMKYRQQTIKSFTTNKVLKSIKKLKLPTDRSQQSVDHTINNDVKYRESLVIDQKRQLEIKYIGKTIKSKTKLKNVCSIVNDDNILQANFQNDQVYEYGKKFIDKGIQTDKIKLKQSLFFSQSQEKNKGFRNKDKSQHQICSRQNSHQFTHIYSHIKSRLFQQAKENRARHSKKSAIVSPTKKLSQLFKQFSFASIEIPKEQVKLYHIQEPVFTFINFFPLSYPDISPLFLTNKNLQEYDSFMNHTRNIKRISTVKRGHSASQRIEIQDFDWNFKKQFNPNQNTETKLIKILFNQMNNIKKKDRRLYEYLKRILTSPMQTCNLVNFEQIKLQSIACAGDIEFHQVKKIISALTRFHTECIKQDKNMICQHLIEFYRKIGIKLC